jgi:CRISPR-associated protein Cas1
MATMYVTEQGARVEKEYRRFLVTKDDEVLAAVPAARLSQVVLVGQVGVTTPALLALLRQEVGLSLVSRSGELLGRLVPPTGKNIPLRHRQYRRAEDPAFCLELSRAIVQGKLCNCRALARRWARTRPEIPPSCMQRIDLAARQAAEAPDLATLRGLEGEGTRHYFAVLRQALAPRPDPQAERGMALSFEKRTRRPPRDPVNALLSLGYTLLTGNLMAACEVVGLDPYDGFFHADKYGRPALALDLMEEFRPVVVDSVVLNVVNRGMVSARDFEPGPAGGVQLKQEALKVFFRQYSARLHAEVAHPDAGRRLTYQQWFEVQAHTLRETIEGKRPAYRPMAVR